MRSLIALTRWWLVGALGLTLAGRADEAGRGAEEGQRFLRFIDKGGSGSRIETAITSYTRKKDGVSVALIGAVHVGDKAYYDALNTEFENYDALLFELIMDEEDSSKKLEGGSGSAVSVIQRGMKDVLELEFQLDGIDYAKKNFVHADMSPKEFSKMQKERGEGLWTFMLRSMLEGLRQQSQGAGSQLNPLALLAVFASKDRALSLKYLMAREFGQMEDMLAGVDKTADGEGSVILSGRNKVAIRVMKREIAAGKKSLGIFYGAGHMPDLEERLHSLGFEESGKRWLTAWDISAKGDASRKER